MAPPTPTKPGEVYALPKSELDALIAELKDRGFEVFGPTVKQHAIAFGPIEGMEDLARAYQSEEEAGRYKLSPSEREEIFGVRFGSDSVKRFLFPPRTELFEVKHTNGTYQLDFVDEPAERRALLGVRGCDLAAIDVLDRTFRDQPAVDPIFARRRENLFLVAVDCQEPGATCFCHSMGTGPRAEGAFDLALSELEEVFVVRVGSELGAEVLAGCQVELPGDEQLQAADAAVERAIERMGREMDPEGLPELLLGNLDHPRWDDVAARCLNCTNCTLVCPTCFCWDVRDRTDLAGTRTVRERVWDSCYNPDHSYHAGGGSARPDVRARYRQWLTHKLGSWVHQFGVSGCVGCGRCITWCPAAIDITEEVAAIRGEGT